MTVVVTLPAKRGRAKNQTASREKLLDAAEKLFALFGYHGASMRDIAGEAGVPLGLATYYFESKEELFRQVIMRRAADHVGNIAASLKEVAKDPSGDIEALIYAFFRPIVQRSVHGGPGWKSYIQLIARASSAKQEEEFLRPLNDVYDPVRHEFIRLAKSMLPGASESSVLWATHFLYSAIIHMLVEGGTIDRLSKGRCKASDLEEILREMAPFFAAGFRQMARK